MKNSLLRQFLLAIMLLCALSANSQSFNITMQKAGKLASQLKKQKEQVVSLKISGNINAKDIIYIRSLPNLSELDLSDVHIEHSSKTINIQHPKNANSQINVSISDGFIPEGCFSNLKRLKRISLPSHMEVISKYAFCGCEELTSVKIPGKSVRVYDTTFELCPKLSEVIIEGQIFSGGQKKIKIERLCIQADVDLSYTNWDNIEGMFSTIFNPHYLFFEKQSCLALYNSFGSHTIQEGTCIIWTKAFYKENMNNIILPNSVTAVGPFAFDECKQLRDVQFSSNLRYIHDYAFRNCSIKKINLPSIEYIASHAFCFNADLEECKFGENLQFLGDYAFLGCNALTHIYLPQTVSEIGSDFVNCINLHAIDVTASIPPKINKEAFPKYVTIFVPSNSYSAYVNSAWNEFVLVKDKCQSEISLTYCRPGKLLESIGSDNLLCVKKITLSGVLDDRDLALFSQMKFLQYVDMEKCTIIENKEKLAQENAYKDFLIALVGKADEMADEQYRRKQVNTKDYIQAKILHSMLKSGRDQENESDTDQQYCIIYKGTFKGLKNLKSVILPRTTTHISHYAFADCSALTDVTCKSNLINIGNSAFENCSSLQRIDLLSVGELYSNCFANCKSLQNLTFSDGLTKIYNDAFSGCWNLKELHLPSTLMQMNNLLGDTGIRTNIHLKGNEPPVLNSTNYLNKYVIYIPKGSKTQYYSSWGNSHYIEE